MSEYDSGDAVIVWDELIGGFRDARVVVKSAPEDEKIFVKIERVRNPVRVRREIVRRPGRFGVTGVVVRDSMEDLAVEVGAASREACDPECSEELHRTEALGFLRLMGENPRWIRRLARMVEP